MVKKKPKKYNNKYAVKAFLEETYCKEQTSITNFKTKYNNKLNNANIPIQNLTPVTNGNENCLLFCLFQFLYQEELTKLCIKDTGS